MYIALYRKWRPKKFEDICGQEHITTSLKNQIKADRISHAYLFCGTRGTGKTSTAKLLAKAVNCLDLKDGNPCEACESCKSINEGNSIDVFEIDAASNRGIDNIRDLREAVKFTPIGKYKLYIIDEVHMLTNEAFNALLKTLEEPPAYVIFILATTEPHKLPSTVLSRCQRFDFKRISQESMLERLAFICKEEGIKVEPEALRLIARNSDGAMRDAISIMDQCAVYSNKNILVEDVSAVLGIVNDRYLFEIADSILKEDITKTMTLLNEISDEGKDMPQFTKDLQIHYRNLLMAKLVLKAEDVIDLSKEKIALLKEQSNDYSKENIIRCINILSDLTTEIKWSPQPKLLLEIALIKMSKLEKDMSNEGLIARIAKLEKIISDGDITITDLSQAKKQSKEEKIVNKKQKDSVAAKDLDKPIKQEQEKEKTNKQELKNDETLNTDKDLKIIESWDGFVKEFGKRKKMILRTYLASCKPMLIDGHKVLLCFEEEDKFSKEAIEVSKTKKEIEDIAEEYFGTPIIIKPVFEDEIEKKEDKDEIKDKNTIDENYVVEKAIELFGEDLVEVVDD